VTADLISAISRFPDDNPNPVLRVGADGYLMYGNPASAGVRRAMGVEVGELIPAELLARLEAEGAIRGSLELVWENRTYTIWPVPIPDMGFMNLYGTDVTAERAIVKFPDQNPNPVIRIHADGTLTYANQASAALIGGLGLALADRLPTDLRFALVQLANAGERGTLDVESADRHYRLLPVDVPEFGFINVYGTDITATRERERLARENERLLLNVLPEPIAHRLRDGEQVIADRFDDVTLMFADIVEFTQLSATMSPSELVVVLNDVFTVVDGLVERHGLEKVKTIGDAYMIVGGLTEDSDDHADRVAALALDLAATVGRVPAAARLGIRFRSGIHRGPVVAGVIGTRKFIYDVWGDTVNLASRMESLGLPGRIQVTHAFMDRLGGSFAFEPRGLVDVKGKGPMPTWFLVGRAGTRRHVAREPHAAPR
jgi:class 3 adenylate cyclase